ncbi:hypothetical protein FVEG_10981 [Fusarium verticillioides 7600]|uniref:Linalool dehydratase/isomerase domain-containing protein n=1 Tax=Gibberella moniliformis (strain M3125 / FGSC 7600) TaxID=334819 RepID=W7MWU7_GIBM7|nr:hypothetical protein FVEG_10981 [Fusarium verticillioides 7600]XP_018758371.1 hypothetical protein FVEG_10981 [Fusarium verticillioides 7600]EWG52179.1 hypothetical protein FVEG_10981 [Fusarium verticillioides 7600]EWG52180.1 hypothetical protein FVEG_10981 [Fusarium verticillioides 7600]
MSKKQVASIRQIGNLARQLTGDWSNMMGRWDLNDGFGAYRFQLAYSFYALALAHFHRLPAAPGLLKFAMEKMINKTVGITGAMRARVEELREPQGPRVGLIPSRKVTSWTALTFKQ